MTAARLPSLLQASLALTLSPGYVFEMPSMKIKNKMPSVKVQTYVGGNPMSKKAAEHHKKASEHSTHAARHHGEAAKHHEAGRHEKAAHHAHTARAHELHARGHAQEAAKAHAEEHGKK